ncbi:MAG: sugar phosphate nucleotidyltransferase [bacterium]|nr:sugar phosphate nucleotidyltransferase [bacterium]
MQAIILAAGNSSRLFPFGGATHKSAISLMGKSFIERTIEAIRSAGISDIIVVVSKGNGVEDILQRSNLDLSGVTFVTHSGARGMGEALLDASSKITEDFFVIHAHHFECEKYLKLLASERTATGASGAIIIKEEADPGSFGVVRLNNGMIVEVTEKPENLTGNHRIVGMYLLQRSFLAILQSAEKHHYSFETALDGFVKQHRVAGVKTNAETITLKFPWHILDVGDYLLKMMTPSIHESAVISSTAVIEENVVISKNVTVENGAVIKGPCYIGENAYVGTNAILRGGVILEKDVVVGAHMEIKHSIIMDGTTTHSGYLGDSVIGKECKLAASFCSGNVRLDRKNVRVKVKGMKVDSGRKSLGVFIGDNTRLGIRVSTMPGVLIGSSVVVGPSTTSFTNIDNGTEYYAKITEVVRKKSGEANVKTGGRKKVVLFDIDYTLFDTKLFKESGLKTFSVYEEASESLGDIGAYAELGIFSEGETQFQKEKLSQTAIDSYFQGEHTHIVAKKYDSLIDVLSKYKDASLYLVDDKLEVLYRAKKFKPDCYTIWMKRGPFATKQQAIEGFSPDATIEDLRMVLGIVAGV